MSLRDLAELVRAPAALSVPGDAIAGATAARCLDPRTAGLAAASVCLYWAGMAANDWADRDLDAVERPERPIPSGRVSPRTALTVASGLTAAGIGLAAAGGGRRAAGMAGLLAGAVWAYDTRWKNTATGPVGMALCRGLDVLLGASIGRVRGAFRPALTIAAHTYLVTALSRREVRGSDRVLPAATLTATALVATVAAGRNGDWSPVALAGWYAARFGKAQQRAWREPSAANVRRAVGAGIASLPVLQGALIAREGRPITGGVVAAAAPIGSRLAKAMAVT